MTTTRTKLGAFAVAVLLVTSTVAAVGVALAANVQRGGTTAQYNPGVGGPNVVVAAPSKPLVFQGEQGIVLRSADGKRLAPSSLVGVSGPAEGQPLDVPIPRDQTPGQYALNGDRNAPGVTVTTPRVTDLQLLNRRGVDVSGASVTGNEVLLVKANWNFQTAEDLALTVRDSNGNDVTGEVLANASALSTRQRTALSGPYATYPGAVRATGHRVEGTGVKYLQGLGQFSARQLAASKPLDAAYWAIDLGSLSEGDYTVQVAGWNNLDFGPAVQTTVVSVRAGGNVNLGLQSRTATRGQTLDFTIRDSTAGSLHTLLVPADAFRNGTADPRVFPLVSNVVDRGTLDTNGDGTANYAYATVEISEDTGLGQGQLDTTYLDTTGVDVNLYPAGERRAAIRNDTSGYEVQRTIRVAKGNVTIDEPSGRYVVGQRVDVNGTAPQGVDGVALYARDQGSWHLLDLNGNGRADQGDVVSVEADGTWKRTDVPLSKVSDVLSVPGRYSLGAVEATDATNASGDLRSTLSLSTFGSATSTQKNVRVTGQKLGGAYRTIDGQVATADGAVDVAGNATGQNAVLSVMVDSRGRVATDQLSVDRNGSYDQRDVPLVTANGTDLNQGDVTGLVVSLGRDDVAGDGSLPGQSGANLAAFQRYVRSFGPDLTRKQVVARIRSQTVGEAGSDDRIRNATFRYTDGSTTISAVARANASNATGVRTIRVGETMNVTGLTNRQPHDNTITVEAVDGPSAGKLKLASTDSWGRDGVWSVKIPTKGIEPGRYTIEASDGENSDTVRVKVVDGGGSTNASSNRSSDVSQLRAGPPLVSMRTG